MKSLIKVLLFLNIIAGGYYIYREYLAPKPLTVEQQAIALASDFLEKMINATPSNVFDKKLEPYFSDSMNEQQSLYGSPVPDFKHYAYTYYRYLNDENSETKDKKIVLNLKSITLNNFLSINMLPLVVDHIAPGIVFDINVKRKYEDQPDENERMYLLVLDNMKLVRLGNQL